MPLAQIEAYKARIGWTLPFVSSHGTFSDDCGAGRGFLLSVFLREGEDVYRTYSTTARGMERLVFVHSILDLTLYGRQEDWEDSPPAGHSAQRMDRRPRSTRDRPEGARVTCGRVGGSLRHTYCAVHSPLGCRVAALSRFQRLMTPIDRTRAARAFSS